MDLLFLFYLIDIKKNNKNNEAFCFFLFITKEMLNEKNITMICEAIEGEKRNKKMVRYLQD